VNISDTPNDLERRLAYLLADFDEAIKGDETADARPFPTVGIPEPAQTELRQAQNCVRLLERIWPRRRGPAVAIVAPPPIAPGSSVGPFQLLEPIGAGGMGTVYKAHDTQLNRVVAIKFLAHQRCRNPHFVDRFQREVRAASSLNHPNICAVYSSGALNGQPYLVMEFVAGNHLGSRLKAGRIDERSAARLVEMLARAMEYAHRNGVVHRDLKPGNILLGADPSRHDNAGADYPKIVDFGLAKLMAEDSGGLTASSDVLGTPFYMAAEQADASVGPIGPATDVYGLGAILYEMLTGRPPFIGDNIAELLGQIRHKEPVAPRRLVPAVNRDMETICLKCLEKEPSRRYSSAQALADDLADFQKGRPIAARPLGRLTRFSRWCRRRPMVSGLAAALMIAVTLGGAGFGWQSHRLARQRENAERREQELNRAWDAAEATYAKLVYVDRNSAVSTTQRWAAVDQLADLSDDLVHQPRLTEKGRKALEDLRESYQQFLTSDSPDRAVRLRTARAYRRLARLSKDLWQMPVARDSYEKARDVLVQLVEENPADSELRFELTICWLVVGSFEFKASGQQPIPSAKIAYDEAHRQIDLLLQDSPANVDYLRISAMILDLKGALALVSGDLDDARRLTLQALEQLAQLDRLQPLSASDRGRKNMFTDKLMQIAMARKDPVEAMRLCRDALATQTAIVNELPKDAKQTSNLAWYHYRLGTIFQMQSNHDEAAKAFAESIRVYRGWVEAYPGVVYESRLLSRVLRTAGHLEVQRKRPAEAEKLYEQQVALWEQAVARNPDDPMCQFDLAGSCYTLSDFLQNHGRPADAGRWRVRSLTLVENLPRTEYADPTFLQPLGRFSRTLAEWQKRENKTDRVERLYQISVESFDRLARANPSRMEYHREHGYSLLLLGQHHLNFGASSAAEAEFRQAIDAYEQIFNGGKPTLADRFSRAVAHNRLGDAHLGLGLHSEAEHHAQVAIDQLRQLVADSPREAYRRELAKYAAEYVAILEKMGDRISAIVANETALAEARQLVSRFPKSTPYRQGLVMRYIKHGNLQTAVRNDDLALMSYRAAVRASPNSMSAINALAWYLCTAPIESHRQPKEAIQWANRLTQMNPESSGVWNTIALARYRNNDLAGALAALDNSKRRSAGASAADLVILAMSQWKLGNQNEAHMALVDAERLAEAEKSQWTDLHMLLNEARLLIGKAPR
jgi:serine/threonine protein kinase